MADDEANNAVDLFRERPMSSHTERRSWRQLWWLLALALGVAAVLGIPFWWHSNSGERDLREAIAETDRLDPAWRWEQIQEKREEIPAEDNGALEALAVQRDIDEKALFEIDVACEDFKPNRQLNWQQEEALKGLEKNQVAVTKARRLKRFSKGRLPARYSEDFVKADVPAQELRTVCVLLDLDVHEQLRVKNWDLAVDSVDSLFHLNGFFGDEAYPYAWLVRFAVRASAIDAMWRALAQAELGEDRLKTWQEMVKAAADQGLLLPALRAERAWNFGFLDSVRTGKVPLSARSFFGKTFSVEPQDVAFYLRSMNEMVQKATGKEHEVFREFVLREIRATDFCSRPDELMDVSSFLHPPRKLVQTAIRDRANLRCMQAALAAERYRLKHRRWPTSQDELVGAGLLRQPLIDPYDGKAIRIKLRPDGLAVYSVFENGTDDGGVFIHFEREANLDYGIQLWNPMERRAPPLPARAGEPPAEPEA
jgi:hypothetical protein